MAYSSGAAGVAAYVYVANATKASGAIVRLDPDEFMKIVSRAKGRLVVVSPARGGIFSRNNEYLMSYKGIFFYTKTPAPLNFPGDSELVNARGFWMPS